MNWGNSIVLAFALFIAFVSVIVYKAMNEDISLTSQDYYQQELDYGTRMQLQKNYNSLAIKPKIETQNGIVKVIFGQKIDNAVVSFYKPDQSKQDFKISTKDTALQVPMLSKAKGLWKVRLSYSVNGMPVYNEESTYIN